MIFINFRAATRLPDPDRLALHSSTLAPALEVALTATHSSDPLVRGNALLSFGHLARRFGEIPRDPVYDLVVRGLADPDSHVRDKQMRRLMIWNSSWAGTWKGREVRFRPKAVALRNL